MSARRSSLKARVGSYARGQGHSNRIARMIAETAAMEFVTTATETEALLLEANLIKQLQAALQRAAAGRQVASLHPAHGRPRGAADRQASRRAQPQGRLFRALRQRLGGEPHHQRPAARLPAALLQRQLLREPHAALPAVPDQALLGPLHAARSRSTNTRSLVDEARAFLSGKSNAVKERLAAEMQAGRRGPRIRARRALPRPPRGALGHAGDAGHQHASRSRRRTSSPSTSRPGSSASRCSSSATARTGATAPTSRRPTSRMSPGEVLASFLAQFYDDKPAPRLVLLSHEIEDAELLAAALVDAGRGAGRDPCAAARRAAPARRVRAAQRHARRSAGGSPTPPRSRSCWPRSARPSASTKPPRRVEVYDNSHIMGTNAVGAMIVAGPAGFMKQHYRTFNMKSEDLTPGDDYGMMREMLQPPLRAAGEGGAARTPSPVSGEGPASERSAARGGAEADLAAPSRSATRLVAGERGRRLFPAWPDLVLIDGGKGQLEAARQALAELGVDRAMRARRHRQGAGPRRRAARPSSCPGSRRSSCRRAIRRSISCSACATRRTASPSAAHRAKRKRELAKNPARRDRRASARPASARCCTISAP